ncbi:MAG: tetratricopeptide repeat protein [Bacteroidota bacterium]
MTRFLSILVFLAALVPATYAQDAAALILDAKQVLQQGLDAGSEESILRARAAFERATGTDDDRLAALAHYYVALTNIRAQVLLDRETEKERMVELVDNAIEHLEASIERDPALPESHALLSSTYGQKLGLKPMLTMFLGPKVSRTMDKAKQLGPDNPRVVFTEAQSLYFTPKMWGGSRERALEGFERAAALYEAETDRDPLLPGWGHDEAYAWQGIALDSFDRTDEARAAFERALEINPNYGWVRYDLLPGLASN